MNRPSAGRGGEKYRCTWLGALLRYCLFLILDLLLPTGMCCLALSHFIFIHSFIQFILSANVYWEPVMLCCIVCAQLLQSCPTLLRPHGLYPAGLLCPWGFSRQEYESGLPCPPPGDLPNPGIKSISPVSPALQAGSLPMEPPRKPKHVLYQALLQVLQI